MFLEAWRRLLHKLGGLKQLNLDEVPPRLLYDKAADTDWLLNALMQCDVELICPHRKNRTRAKHPDGCSLRRYKQRYKVERTINWPQSLKHLLVRHECHKHLFDGFLQLGCMFTILQWF